MNPNISVVIPIYNEEKIIPELYQRLKNAVSKISSNYELIFVNDGSKDNSLYLLMQLTQNDDKVFYINFSRNFGHQIAITAGLDFCSGDAVVIIDGDLQDPPELIPELYEKYKEGHDVVYAKRIQRKGETVLKKITAKVFYFLLRKIATIDIPSDTGDFRLVDKKIVKYLRLMPEKNKFLRGQIAWMGFRQVGVNFIREERKAGKPGYSLSKLINLAIDGFTSFSDKPLKWVVKTGIIVSSISFLIIIYAIISHFFLKQTITGWASLIISSIFIGGVQLISIGIIGEYISRINKNVLERPLYLIENTNLEQKT